MFKIEDQYIILGSKIEVSWNLDSNLRFLFLWYPISWLPWKNYTSIDAAGNAVLNANRKQIEVKIKQIHIWGFKTLGTINRKAYSLAFKDHQSKVSLIESPTLKSYRNHRAEIARLFFNLNSQKINTKSQAIKIKNKKPHIKNILPIQ